MIQKQRYPLPAVIFALVLTAALFSLWSAAHAWMCPAPEEMEVADLINQERQQQGLAPLEIELRLGEAAYLHSEDMATLNYFSHTSLDGSTFVNRIERAGYVEWLRVSENIAAGYTSPASAVNGWMNSSGHRANILDPAVKHIGIGYAYGPSSRYGHYWTTDFGSYADAGVLLPKFNDVAAGHWAERYVRLVACHGIAAGCTQSPPSFCPDAVTTRQAMAAFIIRALFGEAFTYSQTPYFSDVPVTNHFFKYVQKMRDEGITTGCNQAGTLYCPGSAVNRQTMAAFIIRALFGEAFTYSQTPYFSDVPQTHPFFKYVQKMRSEGITTGCNPPSNSQFCPLAPVNRASMSAFIGRAFLDIP